MNVYRDEHTVLCNDEYVIINELRRNYSITCMVFGHHVYRDLCYLHARCTGTQKTFTIAYCHRGDQSHCYTIIIIAHCHKVALIVKNTCNLQTFIFFIIVKVFCVPVHRACK